MECYHLCSHLIFLKSLFHLRPQFGMQSISELLLKDFSKLK